MARHREEETFTIRVELAAEFDEDYEGDDDGYVWLERWTEDVRPRLVRAVFDALRADRRFETVAASRGASPDRTLEIAVTFKAHEHSRD